MTNAASPLQLPERNHVVDVLRGFAILGILMANLAGWITFALPKEQAAQLITTPADKATEIFLSLFVENKFITLFCLLFGYGFGVIIERMKAREIPVVSFFMKRMLVLLVLGIVHLGLWWGEILSTYALCGMLLLLFRKVSDRGLLVWGAVLLLIVGPLLQALKLYLYVEDSEAIGQLYTQYLASIRSANLLRIFEFNYKMVDAIFIRDWSQFRDMAEVLGKFLLGYFVLRKKILSDIANATASFKKVLLIVLPVALLYLVEKSIIHARHLEVDVPFRIMLYLFDRIGILSLSLVYAITIVLLFSRGKLKTVAGIFRPVGMMSLTNYLPHTIFYVLFFYGIGFGMLGVLHLQWMIPIALLIYSVQAVFSQYWMGNMLYGPMEWLWRQASYGTRLPLLRPRGGRS
jgi:uncharacterized protein